MRRYPCAVHNVRQILGSVVASRQFLYGAPFLFALSIPAFAVAFGPFGPPLTVVLLLVVLIGAEWIAPNKKTTAVRGGDVAFRLLPFLYVPVQLGVIGWSVWRAESLAPDGLFSLAFAVGVTTGVFGVLAAHELVHAQDAASQVFGTTMLSAMTYSHFRIAHVFGHHRKAATDDDPATARLGEGVYHFLLRSIVGQYRDVWRIESARLRATRKPLAGHRLLGDAAVMACVYGAILSFVGWRGVALFALQSAVAILVLEVFNYIAHYGLSRHGDGGTYEAFGTAHSWNSSNTFANAFLFNMGRHAQHHAHSTAPYQALEHEDGVRELPYGYAASILLALIPPLWRQIMDPAAQRLHTRPGNVSA